MLVKSKLIKVARDTDKYLQDFIRRQNKTFLLQPMKYGLFSKGKRIRSKILVDVGKIFNVDLDTTYFSGNQPTHASLQACFSRNKPNKKTITSVTNKFVVSFFFSK